MYTDRRCKPWTSRSWAPEGYASREEYARLRGDGEKTAAHGENSRDSSPRGDPKTGPYAAQGGLGAEKPSRDGDHGASAFDPSGGKRTESLEHREHAV